MFREHEIFCPTCNHGNCHMINTWIIGSSVISCNGISSMEDPSLLRLFPILEAYRGSRVIILFESEHCNHYWFTVTEFHKGQTFVWDLELTEEEIEKEHLKSKDGSLCNMQMWRD